MIWLIKHFYIFWQNISYGLDGMEYRAVATILVGLYFNVISVIRILSDSADGFDEGFQYLFIGLLIVLYAWLPHYLRSNYNLELSRFDKVGLKQRAQSVIIVILYFSITYWIYQIKI